MKFAEHLSAHITPEWRKQYIQYEEMKAMLYDVLEEAPSPEVVEEEIVTRYLANYEEKFFTFCESELKKINIFYSEKLAEAQRKFSTLQNELELATRQQQSSLRSNASGFKGYLLSGWRKTTGESKWNGDKSLNEHVVVRKIGDLKLAFSEYYLSLVLLQNYQSLNFTGFRKILKKHDKNIKTESGAKWHRDHVETSIFYSNKTIDKLISETESCFISQLESGDRQKAMKRLRVPPLNDKHSPWTTFKVGLFSGAFTVLLVAVVLSSIFHDYHVFGDSLSQKFSWESKSEQLSSTLAFRLYRGPLLLIIFVFLLGIDVYGWRSSGVNHVLIFELDPRNHLSEQHLMEVAATLGVVWTLSVLTFIYSDFLAIPAFINPLSLIVIMFAFMFNPTKTFRYEARFWVIRVLGRIFAAPFFYVGFADFWVADQLNSLSVTFTDFSYIICFYYNADFILDESWHTVETRRSECCPRYYQNRASFIATAIVKCLPAWFRFAQCLRRYRDTKESFPHLANAGKYSTTFFVVLFSTLSQAYNLENLDDDNDEPSMWYICLTNFFFYAWIVSGVVSSTYSYAWDIKMDWGLFDSNAGENYFLREEIVYSSKNYYYFAIIEDLVLRFTWLISYELKKRLNLNADILECITSTLEVFRRFIWNFFRLENEHLNNCGKFRAVRDISVAPIQTSDQALIIRMMDEVDGIERVRREKLNLSSENNRQKQQRLLTTGSIMNTTTNTISSRKSFTEAGTHLLSRHFMRSGGAANQAVKV